MIGVKIPEFLGRVTTQEQNHHFCRRNNTLVSQQESVHTIQIFKTVFGFAV